MLKKVIPLVVMFVAVASWAYPQTVVGTDHDLSNDGNTAEVCVYCHTPHQATAAAGQDPLWNHTLSTVASYGVYASTTLDSSPTDIGGAVAGSASVSNLCMSCHDGTVAPSSLYNNPNAGAPTAIALLTGGANLGQALSDDHPINFNYDAALATSDGGLVTPTDATTVDGTIPLFGGTVQCASCHDPHDDTNSPFLVATNSNSGLCTRCHLK